MADKDFLSQFSGENKKPESFREEERIPVSKPKMNISGKAVAIAAVLLILILGGCYWLFMVPKIELPDFEGRPRNEVAAWVKQYGIETSGIVFQESYDFDSAEGTVLSQSVKGGTKVKENVKLTFVTSLGPDPSERVAVPDLKSMDKEDIDDWIRANKLTKTKITTSYNASVPAGEVISYSFSGCDEDTFTRSSTLKISVSKGPEPAGTITVEDFRGKYYEEVETWAKTKKVTLTKTEMFSDSVAEGKVISQSVSSGKTMKEGETISVVVSKGKGVVVPNFMSMSKEDFNDWTLSHTDMSVKISKEIYSSSDDYILEQSIRPGMTISASETVLLTANMGNGFFLNDVYKLDSLNGGSYDRFKLWADSEAEALGLDVDTHKVYVNSSEMRGTILGIQNIKGKYCDYTEKQLLPLEVEIYCYVSDGTEAVPEEKDYKLTDEDVTALTSQKYEDIVEWCDRKGIVIQIVDDADKQIVADEASTYTAECFVSSDSYGSEIRHSVTSGNLIPKNVTLKLKKD